MWPLILRALGELAPPKSYRPFPVRRPFEVEGAGRAALEMLVELGEEGSLDAYGLPSTSTEMSRFLGRTETPLDVRVHVDGHDHPAWMLVSDALYGVREVSSVVALLASLAPESVAKLWRSLLETSAHHLRDPIARTPEERAKDTMSIPSKQAEHRAGLVDLLVRLSVAQGDAGATLAESLASDMSKKAELDAFEVVVVLRSLLAHAKLTPGHDALLLHPDVVNHAWDIQPSLVAVLEGLPRERAIRAAGDAPELVARFPSVEGVTRIVHALEKTDSRYYGTYYEGLIRKAVLAVGEPIISVLRESLARKHPRHAFIKDCLARLEKKKKH